MKILKIIFSLFLVVAITTSCEEKFEEINTNVNDPEKVTVDVLLTYSLNAQLNDFGGFGTGIWDAFTQHQAGNHARGVDYDQYIIDNGHENGTFSNMYRQSLKDLNTIISQGTEEGNMQYVGVAKIVTAFGLGYLTNMYGDIPWSKALDINNTNEITYDSQEQIYITILDLLAQAKNDLAVSGGIPLSNGDYIYGGDASKWIALAWALEARYMNHTVGKLATSTDAAVIAAADAAIAAGFADFEQKYEGNADHASRWGTHWENNTVVASASFMQALVESPRIPTAVAGGTRRDPRLEAFFDNSRFPDNDTLPEVILADGHFQAYDGVVGSDIFGEADGYCGKVNGFGVTSDSFSPVGPYGAFGEYGSPTPLLTTAELHFIKAEAQVRSGANAAAAFAAGANYSIDKYAPIGRAVYASRGMTVASDVALYQAELDARVTAYKAGIAAIANPTMADVMQEKYMAMMGVEHESWMDLRRHDYAYPSWITPPMNKQGPAGAYIERFLYPQVELDQNFNNVPQGVTIFDPLWVTQ